jgi:hypothetical protein
MAQLSVLSKLRYWVNDDSVDGDVVITIDGRSATYHLKISNPDSDEKVEARFSKDGNEILHIKPSDGLSDELTPMQKALIWVSDPMFEAGGEVYNDARARLSLSPRGREIIQTMQVELSIGKDYQTKAQISEEAARGIAVLFESQEA